MALTKQQLRALREAPVNAAGNRLQAAIDLAESNQIAVGRAIGMSNTYVSDVVRGRNSNPTVETAYKFAAFFGCAIEDLFPPKVAA